MTLGFPLGASSLLAALCLPQLRAAAAAEASVATDTVVSVCIGSGADAYAVEGEDIEDGDVSLLQRRKETKVATPVAEAVSDEAETESPAAAAAAALAEVLLSEGTASSRRRRGGGHGHGQAGASPAPSVSSAASASSLPGGPVPTATELETLAAVIGRLWTIDAPYRLKPGAGFKLNTQARAASLSSGKDMSPQPLFSYVSDRDFKKMPCSSQFMSLLDNYERDTSRGEVVTAHERLEQDSFVKCAMETPHMKYVFNVLVDWGTISNDYRAFQEKVSTIWFVLYRLSGRGPKASSGFEHVFVGEEKLDRRTHRPTIVGLHNWIQFWREERAKKIDYLGYVGKGSGKSLISARFSWDDDDPAVETKSISTFLVGSSPPFELAMLTCAFLGFGGEAKVSGIYFGNEGPATLIAYKWTAPEGTLVRTAYLES